MFKKLKNKKAQSLLEFAIAIPVVMLVTLGVIDIAKGCIVKMETQQALQSFVSKAASFGEYRVDNIRLNASNYIQQTSLFCHHVSGQPQPACASRKGVHAIETELRFEREEKGSFKAGDVVCLAAKTQYPTVYKGVYSDGKMTIYSRACTTLETPREDRSSWSPIKYGAW